MSMFMCLVNHSGRATSSAMCQRYSIKRAAHTVIPARWYHGTGFSALLGSDVEGLEASVVTARSLIGVGIMRLENRAEVASWAGQPHAATDDEHCDLELTLLAAERVGLEWVLRRVMGDFAVVVWEPAAHRAFAARDAFGVRRLFVRRCGETTAFASRASLLSETDDYNLEYFAEYLVNGYDASDRTAFADVGAVEAGEIYSVRDCIVSRQRYWPTADTAPPLPSDWSTAVTGFRDLLASAVLTRVGSQRRTWAQLSGGMDSSSIVAIAQMQATASPTGSELGGAITYVTVPEIGGDPAAARAVARAWGLRLEVLKDWWLWQDDSSGLPMYDQPCAGLAGYAIDRRTTQLVRQAGGRALLAGVGADVYLRPSLDFIARAFARGHFRRATRELATWAAEIRSSVWALGYQHGVYPLLPAPARLALARPAYRVPSWIAPSFRRRFQLWGRCPAVRNYAGSVLHDSDVRVMRRLHAEGMLLPTERFAEGNLDWRYPFLSRPLVEYVLQFPRDWLLAPGMSKRVLREAMRGLLPDSVRLRQGKGGIRPQASAALSMEHDRITALLEHSILEELGCVDTSKLNTAIERTRSGQSQLGGAILNTLTLEMWLRSRTDRWSDTRSGTRVAASHIAHDMISLTGELQ